MKFNNILKTNYALLNEAPPAELDDPQPQAQPETPPEAEAPQETKLDTQGVQYLVDLVRKALLIDKLDDREKADMLNLKVDANNAMSNLENNILPILRKYIPDTTT